jgi:hypothetical protein
LSNTTKAISGDGDNGVPESFKIVSTLSIETRRLSVGIGPPQIFFAIVVTEDHHTPTGVF